MTRALSLCFGLGCAIWFLFSRASGGSLLAFLLNPSPGLAFAFVLLFGRMTAASFAHLSEKLVERISQFAQLAELCLHL